MPDGRYLELELSPIQTAGVTTGIAVIARDVTQWKQAEQMLRQTENSLRESEDRYRLALQATPDAININRMSDGTYIEVNEAFLAITGYERSEVIGRSSLELAIWKDEADRDKLIEALRLNGSCRDMEIQFRRKN
jgi:PAS domain-containing protein